MFNYSHTGYINRNNINNFSRNVCNSISTSAAPESLATVLMNGKLFISHKTEEKLYINENINVNNLYILSDSDFSLIEKNISDIPMPNKALIELFDESGK